MIRQKRFSELLAEWRKDTGWKALWETANDKMPYDLNAQGYEFYIAWIQGDRYGSYRCRDYFAAALVRDWMVEKEWDYIPTLAEIFEIFNSATQ